MCLVCQRDFSKSILENREVITQKRIYSSEKSIKNVVFLTHHGGRYVTLFMAGHLNVEIMGKYK